MRRYSPWLWLCSLVTCDPHRKEDLMNEFNFSMTQWLNDICCCPQQNDTWQIISYLMILRSLVTRHGFISIMFGHEAPRDCIISCSVIQQTWQPTAMQGPMADWANLNDLQPLLQRYYSVDVETRPSQTKTSRHGVTQRSVEKRNWRVSRMPNCKWFKQQTY